MPIPCRNASNYDITEEYYIFKRSPKQTFTLSNDANFSNFNPK